LGKSAQNGGGSDLPKPWPGRDPGTSAATADAEADDLPTSADLEQDRYARSSCTQIKPARVE